MSTFSREIKKAVIERHLQRGGTLDEDGLPIHPIVSPVVVDSGLKEHVEEETKDSGDSKPDIVTSEGSKTVEEHADKNADLEKMMGGDSKDSEDVKNVEVEDKLGDEKIKDGEDQVVVEDSKDLVSEIKDSGDFKQVVLSSEKTTAVMDHKIVDEKTGDFKNLTEHVIGDNKVSGDSKTVVVVHWDGSAITTEQAAGETKDETVQVAALTTDLQKFNIDGVQLTAEDVGAAQEEATDTQDHGDVADTSDADSAVVEDHEEHSDDDNIKE